MSELPSEAVREFVELHRQEYGIELSDQEAVLRACNFLNLYAAVLGDYGESIPEKERSP